MLLVNLFSNPLYFIIFLVAILAAITIHESAHAWAALKLGDPTAKLEGRLTLNPFAHLDFLGTIFLLIAGFGWGKPVPINPYNFKNPKRDELLSSLAGPASNLALAIVLGIIYRFLPQQDLIANTLAIIIYFNLVLMVFNLLPVPPLDGSKILRYFLSEESYYRIQQLGIPLLFVLLLIIFLFSDIFRQIISSIFNLIVGGGFSF